MKINENIFREYDIRGIVNLDFSDSLVKDLGKSFGTYVYKKGGRTISVSGDIRESSPRLKRIFITLGTKISGQNSLQQAVCVLKKRL